MGLRGRVGLPRFLLEISSLVKSKKGWLFLSYCLHNKLPFDINTHLGFILTNFKELFY